MKTVRVIGHAFILAFFFGFAPDRVILASSDEPLDGNRTVPNAGQAGPGISSGSNRTNISTKDQEAIDREQAWWNEQRTKAEKKRQHDFEINRTKGAVFLAENAKREGIRALPSGLQFKVLSEGCGERPTTDVTVKVNCKGQVLGGEEFHNSWKAGKPAILTLHRDLMIKGLFEALMLMREGDHWQIFMPYNLGLGDKGIPSENIPAGATLIYDIELISIISPKPVVGGAAPVDGRGKSASR
jgi:FKBP-type peptidyl-prolyl cis-trans isomerase